MEMKNIPHFYKCILFFLSIMTEKYISDISQVNKVIFVFPILLKPVEMHIYFIATFEVK